MKRRRFVQALIAAPAVPAALAQQPAPPAPAPSLEGIPKIGIAVPDAGAETVAKFFSKEQFAALRRVSEILMPPGAGGAGSPGALDAGAPEFLDFLIGASDAARQRVYRSGLDALNAQARKNFNKSFSDLDASQAESLMSALHQPWGYQPPADPAAEFLQSAKQDVRTATLNSREYSVGRRFAGSGLYWYPLD